MKNLAVLISMVILATGFVFIGGCAEDEPETVEEAIQRNVEDVEEQAEETSEDLEDAAGELKEGAEEAAEDL